MTTAIPFSRYNEEFSSLISQTRQTLSSITSILDQHDNNNVDVESLSNPTAEDKNTIQQKINLASNLLNQTKDLLKQMTIESRSIPKNNPNDVQECKKMLQIAKANHANLKDDVTAVQNQVNHYLLLSSNGGSGGSGSNNNNARRKNKNGVNSEVREHLLSTTDNLHNQNSNLEKSKQIMADTELIAMEINEELARNRETIESAHSRVRGVNSLSNHARRILVNMGRREVQQKMVVYGVGIILFLVLLFLLGFF
jgi:hypothetical protein